MINPRVVQRIGEFLFIAGLLLLVLFFHEPMLLWINQ